MTIHEEIAALKTQLEAIVEPREQADLLLKLLYRSKKIMDDSFGTYINQLQELSVELNAPALQAYAVFYQGMIAHNAHQFEEALTRQQQAIGQFESIDHKPGMIDCNIAIGLAKSYSGRYQESFENYFAARDMAEAISDKQRICLSNSRIGASYHGLGKFPEALEHMAISQQIANEIGDIKTAGVEYNNMAIIYLHQGNYSRSLEYNFKSLKVAEQVGDNAWLAGTYNNIGMIYQDQRNYKEALKNFEAALENAKTSGHLRAQGGISGNIGKVHEQLGNQEAAVDSYLMGLDLARKAGEQMVIGFNSNSLGKLYTQQGRYAEASEYLDKALNVFTELDNKIGIGESYYGMGSLYLVQAKYEEALKAFKLAEETYNQTDAKSHLRELFYELSKLYQQTGNYKESLEYYKQYDQLNMEILGAESQKQISNLRVTHDLETKEKQLETERLFSAKLQTEKDRSEELLLNILPEEVAEELKETGKAEAKLFDRVTVLFTDFSGFTTVSEKLTPQQLVNELHECFSGFDAIMEKHGIEKIKTVGDAYLAVSGLPVADPNHAPKMIRAALEIRDFMQQRKQENPDTFEVRIGIHSGQVVAGIVGVKKFAYDIWGDTVNTAARMEQNGEAGKVNISQATYELVKDQFQTTYRGKIEAKNKGALNMYFVE